ncbi:MAG: methyltransferase domain-containing protein, partial [Halobaculum sp.]
MNAPEFYTAFARLYDAVARAPGVGRVRDEFAAALAPDEGDTVLDVGCGTGANHRPLREEIGPEGIYVGVDFSPGVLRIARE